MEKIYNSFREIEYELSGAKDFSYSILSLFIVFFVPTIGFVIMQINILPWIWGLFGGFIVCLLYIMGLLMYRKSYIKVDKTGISGQGRVGGGLNSHLVTFDVSWQDITGIRFNSNSPMDIENRIEIAVGENVYVYTFSFHFAKHKDLFDAIRTLGRENLLDDEAIRSLEKSDSLVSVILKSIGFGAFLLVGSLIWL